MTPTTLTSLIGCIGRPDDCGCLQCGDVKRLRLWLKQPMKIHQLSVEDALRSLRSKPEGLSSEEALRRLREFGPIAWRESLANLLGSAYSGNSPGSFR
jgi:hypothetical protein